MVSVKGVSVQVVSVKGVSDQGVCVLGVSVRGVHVREGFVLSPYRFIYIIMYHAYVLYHAGLFKCISNFIK